MRVSRGLRIPTGNGKDVFASKVTEDNEGKNLANSKISIMQTYERQIIKFISFLVVFVIVMGSIVGIIWMNSRTPGDQSKQSSKVSLDSPASAIHENLVVGEANKTGLNSSTTRQERAANDNANAPVTIGDSRIYLFNESGVDIKIEFGRQATGMVLENKTNQNITINPKDIVVRTRKGSLVPYTLYDIDFLGGAGVLGASAHVGPGRTGRYYLGALAGPGPAPFVVNDEIIRINIGRFQVFPHAKNLPNGERGEAALSDSSQPRAYAASLTPTPVESPHLVNCGKTKEKAERLICSNAALLESDGKLAAIFRNARNHSDDPEYLDASQDDWEKSIRNRCNDIECLQEAYQSRIAEIAPSEEVDRPSSNSGRRVLRSIRARH